VVSWFRFLDAIFDARSFKAGFTARIDVHAQP